MKNKIIYLFTFVCIAVSACQKDNMAEVDLGLYEDLLKTDFINASQNHDALAGSVSADDHNSHHSGAGGAGSFDPSYLKMMFNKNDSLFSEHFYEFCIDMMNNGGMMGGKGSMMGNHGSMMNGGMMGNMMDMKEMMNHMDSLHISGRDMLNANHMITDSLMYKSMSECKMFTSGTENITTIFQNMQVLRKDHYASHGK